MTNAVVYMPLLDGPVTTWRPVLAEPLGGSTFRISAHQPYDREAEHWEFSPGSVVRCRPQELSDGIYTAAFELVHAPTDS